MSREIHKNVRTEITSAQLQTGGTYLDARGKEMEIDSALLTSDGVVILERGGKELVLEAEALVTVVYAEAVQARDLEEGDELIGGHGLILRATNVIKEGGQVSFNVTDLDTTEQVTVPEDAFLELA